MPSGWGEGTRPDNSWAARAVGYLGSLGLMAVQDWRGRVWCSGPSRTVREPGGAIPPGYSLETIVMSQGRRWHPSPSASPTMIN